MKLSAPNSWQIADIGEIAQIISGGTPPSRESDCFAPPKSAIPWITPADLSGYKNKFISHGARDLTEKGLNSCSARLMPKGSVLFSSRAPIGYVAIAENQISTNQGFKSFVFPQDIDNGFAYYQLRYITPEAEARATGTTFKELSGSAAAKLPFLVAPKEEQRRIADKLDTTLARIDALNDRLARITPLLKRFRQSVLAAATSGRLTEDWRANSQAENEWRSVSLKEVASDFSYGSSAKSAKTGKVPVLRMGNIQEGALDWTDLVYTSDPEEIKKYKLVKGDVLFNRTNSPELVGKTAIYQGEQEAIYAGYLIRVKCSEKLIPEYLNYCLGSPMGRDYCWQVKSDGVSQSNINAKKLAAFEFLLPPTDEQTEIVRRVEILFAFADRLEARLQSAQTAAERLTPALLAKAFRGELVPQDPNDEPAAELLRRLRAARAADTASKPKRGRAAKAPTVSE